MVEVLKFVVERFLNDKVIVKVIYAVVGVIIELDVILVFVFDVIIIGFNVRLEVGVMLFVEKEKVDVRMYRIIYDVINDIEAVMKGLFEFVYKEVVIGYVEVR